MMVKNAFLSVVVLTLIRIRPLVITALARGVVGLPVNGTRTTKERIEPELLSRYAYPVIGGKQMPHNLRFSPLPEKFFLMHCATGQASNRIICFRKALVLSGLLNRTLLVIDDPNEIVLNYNQTEMFDIGHTRRCLGPDSVITTSEYLKKYQKSVVEVDSVVCLPGACPNRPLATFHDTRSYQGWKSVNFKVGIVRETLRLRQRLVNLTEIEKVFAAAKGRVLYSGDLYHFKFSGFDDFELFNKDTPFSLLPSCTSKLVVQPQKSLFEAANDLIKSIFGSHDYISIHLRRGDFRGYCKSFNDSCYLPLEKVIDCIHKTMVDANVTSIFLATNGHKDEVLTLKKCFEDNQGIPIVKMVVSSDVRGKASEALLNHGLHNNTLELLEIDKLVCVRGKRFLGTNHSTFSGDIDRMRRGLNIDYRKDSFICDQ